MPALNEITPSQLPRLIATPTCAAIIDVHPPEGFKADPRLIRQARPRR